MAQRRYCRGDVAPVSSATTLITGHWIGVHDGDPRALALMKRHYSYRRRAHGQPRGSPTFIGQGEKMVLMTLACDALFAWQRSTIQRDSGEVGINCTVFRREVLCLVLASDLVKEADDLAFQKWPGERHYTYVNSRKVLSTNPGYCFLMAGWRKCGASKGGLLILEKLP